MLFLIIVLALVGGVLFYLNTYPAQASQHCIRAARFVCGMRLCSVTVDRYEWHYLDSDDGTNKPILLLIHGYGADKESWLGYSRLLKSHYRVIAPDLPGFGDSDRNVYDDYSPRQQAKRLAIFCRAIGIHDLNVTGSSMGGYICCWFAIDHGHYISSVTLMNAAGVFGSHPSKVQTAAENGDNILMIRNEDDFSALLRLLTPKPPFMPRFMRRYAVANYIAHGAQLDQIFWQLVASQQSDELQTELAGIDAPALIVWGDHDDVIDVSCANVFAESIRESELLILPGKGHIPMFEAPVVTARRQREFIESVRASSHASAANQ